MLDNLTIKLTECCQYSAFRSILDSSVVLVSVFESAVASEAK
jgi:hypothetical protein